MHIAEVVSMWFTQPHPASLPFWQLSRLNSEIKAQDFLSLALASESFLSESSSQLQSTDKQRCFRGTLFAIPDVSAVGIWTAFDFIGL